MLSHLIHSLAKHAPHELKQLQMIILHVWCRWWIQPFFTRYPKQIQWWIKHSFYCFFQELCNKKKILDPRYKLHSYGPSKKFTHYHVYHNKTKNNTYFSSPFTNCVKGLNHLVDKFLGLLACEIILHFFPKILYHANESEIWHSLTYASWQPGGL